MSPGFLKSFEHLKSYCEQQGFKGWDPYDGLNSKLFKAIPFINKSRVARLGWIQLLKRSPLNLRPFLKIEKSYNSKGLALFLNGYCNLYQMDRGQDNLEKINFLSEKLLDLQIKGYSGSCWGYDFDWQARAFFQPANTPTVVATSFVADALMNSYEITKDTILLDTAISSAEFILKDLNRNYDTKGNFCFSYSPRDNKIVYNASLLGARLLSRSFAYSKNENHSMEARKAVNYVCDQQREDGTWVYGSQGFHNWIDSFHTGFNLECIYEYEKYTGDTSFENQLEKGFEYYIRNFFTHDGRSKYYHDQIYPIDIHAPAQLIITLFKLGKFPEYEWLANKVMNWTIENMQHKDGYFYYQKRKGYDSTIPFMRWAQAWMFYAMSYYLKQNEPAL